MRHGMHGLRGDRRLPDQHALQGGCRLHSVFLWDVMYASLCDKELVALLPAHEACPAPTLAA